MRHFIRTVFRRREIRYALLALLVLVLAVNVFVSMLYVQQNKTALLFDKRVQVLLPAYREMRNIGKVFANMLYIPRMRFDVGIPSYELRIEREDLKKLNKNIPSSISAEVFAGQVFLTDEFKKTIPATFTHGGIEYKVKVRYRGDNPNHWTRSKRSWQVIFDKDNLFEGKRILKLIIPIDRDYFAEALNNYRATKFGLFYPEAKFVTLSINGTNHGVYWQVEDFSSEALERNERPADSSFYSNDDDYIRAVKLGERGGSIFEDERFWSRQTKDTLFPFDNYGEIDFLVYLLKRDDFSSIAPDIVDLDSFYGWQLVAMLAGSDHQSDEGNIRLYFNNSSGKFEFVPWDVLVTDMSPDRLSSATVFSRKLFEDPNRALERNKRLWEYVSDDSQLDDDLAFYDSLSRVVRPAFYADFRKHDSNRTFDAKVAASRNQFIANIEMIKSTFKKDNSRATLSYDSQRQIITLDFFLHNFSGMYLKELSIPVTLPAFANLYYDSDGNGVFGRGDQWVSSSISESDDDDALITFSGSETLLYSKENSIGLETTTHTFFVVFSSLARSTLALDDVTFVMRNAVTGKKVKIKDIRAIDRTTFRYFDDIRKTPREFVITHPNFDLSGNSIVLSSGTHVINDTIVVPRGTKLIISPGATLLFAPDVSLISYSPIIARGTVAAPIIFAPLVFGKPWGVVAVINTEDNQSIFSQVRLKSGSGAYINGVHYTGMLSAYHADVILENSIIERGQNDDGVNVKYGNLSITGNIFRNNSADALDVDFGSGSIAKNTFFDNGDDGIDLSGSTLLIENNRIARSGDKCISIGEKSLKPVIFNNILTDCAVGIEVKDASTPLIINNVILNNGVGLNSYRKKDIFESGGLPAVYNSIIWNNNTSIIEDEISDIKISYSSIEGGFSGEGNVEIEPQGFFLAEVGYTDILAEILDIEVAEVSMGLFNTVQP